MFVQDPYGLFICKVQFICKGHFLRCIWLKSVFFSSSFAWLCVYWFFFFSMNSVNKLFVDQMAVYINWHPVEMVQCLWFSSKPPLHTLNYKVNQVIDMVVKFLSSCFQHGAASCLSFALNNLLRVETQLKPVQPPKYEAVNGFCHRQWFLVSFL